MPAERPILNPTLRLLLEPTQVAGPGGGKSERTIRRDRLASQRQLLAESLLEIAGNDGRVARSAGHTLVVARMFSDSLAPSHTPNDLFSDDIGCSLVAPLKSGYLIEVPDAALKILARRVGSTERVAQLSDISRVKRIKVFDRKAILRGQTLESLWGKGRQMDGGDARLFTAWLMPYNSDAAREEVVARFQRLGTTAVRRIGTEQSVVPAASLGRALRDYRATQGVGRSVVQVESQAELGRIVASGSVFRLDPVRRVSLASAPDDTSSAIPVTHAAGPVVAVIDGGLTNPAYAAVEAWRTQPLIPDGEADADHGNAVASLVAHGAQLNNAFNLPDLPCRLGIAQAVPKADSVTSFIPDDLYDLLSRVAVAHRDTRVWNLSFNLEDWDDDPEIMSDFGHQISTIARIADVLPVISVGNRDGGKFGLLPPADAEAAISVGGRSNAKGIVAGPCSACCAGPGPGGALKPEVSWYSPISVAGGKSVRGSSYPTALVSGLAAHTFENLKEPNPDLVKALILSKCEREEHDPFLGWGSPFHDTAPWECSTGTVCLAWTAHLGPGFDYYWNDIPVPPEMIDGEHLSGGASLTAILQPLTSPFAEFNYFSTRLEVTLQYRSRRDTWENLLGTMKESTISEEDARRDLKKWQPTRYHRRDRFRHIMSQRPSFRLRARLYTRDLFQTTLPNRASLAPQRVSIVLSLKGRDGDDGIYNSMVQRLGAYVDSAVVEQDISVVT